MQHVLQTLGTTIDKITVGRVPPIGRSADPRIASRQSADLLNNPMFYAKGPSGECAITRADLDALAAAGAKVEGPLYF